MMKSVRELFWIPKYEYANSRDSVRAKGTIGKAKANATQALPELILTAENISFKENMEDKHAVNAKYG